MRWVTFRDPSERDAGERVGLVENSQVHVLARGESLLGLLGDDGERLDRAAKTARHDPAAVLPLQALSLLSPIPRPPSVRDFYAFEEHVRTARRRRGLEMEPDWYELPVFYFSNPSATIATGDDVPVPAGCAELDYELEVAAVVGRGGSDIGAERGEAHIAGYMVMNDWSARDIQRREMKLCLGPAKGKDFATTLGPMLVTPDELEDARGGHAYDLAMTAAVNGREYSRASLADIHWSFGEMVAYASRGTRVVPGDIIGTGTCGTGCILELALVHGGAAYPWLQPGDEVALAVERLGTVTNRIVAGPPLRRLR